MIPSVLASQIRTGVEDFLRTTFPASNPFFHGMMDRLLDRPAGVFQDTYVSIRLPYRPGSGDVTFFPEVPLPFKPYQHQEAAFRRLTGLTPRSTIIATGTGSGKTEGFLYPILEYCYKKRGERGIKAILIYPMNALATDQAGRFARTIHSISALRDSLRAGLYIGGEELVKARSMTPEMIITDHEAMRLDPPDILLTNYKMLDYLLIRPRDYKLWAQNDPQTLKYLVVDELHTFDGAQGTDLACLIRRLKSRARSSEGHLCCIGTSATLGTPADSQILRDYTAEIFGEHFDSESIVTESLLEPSEFFSDALVALSGAVSSERSSELDPYIYDTELDYLASQVRLWFNKEIVSVESLDWRITLSEALRRHAFFRNLILALDNRPVSMSRLIEVMDRVTPEFAGASSLDKQRNIESMISLISAARTPTGDEVVPFLHVRMQPWMRELRRMVASVSHPPELAHSDDLKADDLKIRLPVIHCRECGAMGWAATKRQQDDVLNPDLKHFYAAFFSHDPTVHFVYPLTGDEPWGTEDLYSDLHLCGACLHLTDQERPAVCPACGDSDRLIRVFVENPRRRTENTTYTTHDCPYCLSYNSLTVLGSQAASMTAVVISQLYSSKYNDDKKSLAFSDSVQDASHRAGFFAARTFRFNFRAALQQFVQTQNNPLLSKIVPDFIAAWLTKWRRRKFIASFLPPDMAWMRDYETLIEEGELPEGSSLLLDLEKRIGWEIVSEYGFNSRIGRTLEKTGCSIAFVIRNKLEDTIKTARETVSNEIGAFRDTSDSTMRTLIAGIVYQLRIRGGILHPDLQEYINSWGNTFLINRIPYMPNFGRFTRAPSFLTRKRGTRFDPLLGSGNTPSWYEHWVIKVIGSQAASYTDEVLTTILNNLTSADILKELRVEGSSVWGIEPSALAISTEVRHLRCTRCGHLLSCSDQEADSWTLQPCLRFHCSGSYALEQKTDDYYGRLYSKGDVERIFSEEHTSLIDRKTREEIEKRFIRSSEPGDPNLLSCTPTLELGIDIGDLSSVILCSVPPAQPNYVQRIGRAGRRDGNSLAVTVANARPHDLYFFAEPEEMIAGNVQPPGCFLNAPAVLERQFTAYCFDQWVESGIGSHDLPYRLGQVLSNLEKTQRIGIFPFTFFNFFETNRSVLLKGFVAIFAGRLEELAMTYLKEFVEGDERREGSFVYRIHNRLHGLLKEQKALRKRVQKLNDAIKKKRTAPVRDQNYQSEMDELETEKTALNRIISGIGDKDVFNFFTDEGLLPNYAFPEAGVLLRSIILRKKIHADSKGLYDARIYEYERPAATAISELAPENTFYAEKRKVVIDQIDMGLSEVEEWRFCPECSFHERTVTAVNEGTCPRCSHAMWSDEGQKRNMIRMRQVTATTYDRNSRYQDDSDEREPIFYKKHLLVNIHQDSVRLAFKMDDSEVPFGFEYLSKVTLREINFGKIDAHSDDLSIAGAEVPSRGFVVCKECGKIQSTRKPNQHSLSCRFRNAPTSSAMEECLYLYREFTSEAIRILLPVISMSESRKLYSFMAAMYLGLKRKFKGNIDHLRTALHTEPIGASDLRKRFLVLYDSVPGGTGYLKELMRSPQILMQVFEEALNVLRACVCRQSPDKDGCYRCLFAYRLSQERPEISRDLAIELLAALVDRKEKLIPTDTVSNISVNSLLESDLEARFIEALRRSSYREQPVLLTREVVNGKPGWHLKINERGYLLEPQVELSSADVRVASRPDFVLYPERQRDGIPVTIFLDGFAFHADVSNSYRVEKDFAQRMAILQSKKFRVWSLSWDDVEDRLNPRGHIFFENFLTQSGSSLNNLLDAYKMNTWKGRHDLKNFDLFLQYLADPDGSYWRLYAFLLCLSLPIRKASQSVDVITETIMKAFNVDRLPWPQSEDQYLSALDKKYQDGRSMLRAISYGPVQDIRSNKTDSISVLCSLSDEPEIAGLPGFRASWNGFLRLTNFLQFCKNVFFMTSRSVSSGLFHERIRPQVIEFSPTGDSELMVLLELTDPGYHDFLRRVSEAGLPLPIPGYELAGNFGEVIASAEFAWPNYQIAVLREDEWRYEAEFRSKNWHTFALQNVLIKPHEFLKSLKEAK